MATAIERHIGPLNDAPDAHSQQSRRNSIEIIDVDTFEGEAGGSSQSGRVRGRQDPQERETISLVDSDDDEVQIVSSRIRSGHNVDRSRSHRQFISPPPRNFRGSIPPPTPAIPARYAGHTSLPMRRIPEYPPVIALTGPVTFELRSSPPIAGPSNPPQRAAPASHHTPVMGLGGALITSNRAQLVRRQGEVTVASGSRRRPHALRRHYTVTERDDDTYIHMLLNPYIDEEFLPLTWRHLINRGGALEVPAEKEQQYQQSYTHPSTPEPGFTFDFAAPEDEPGQNGTFFPPTSKDEPIVLDDDEKVTEPIVGSSATGVPHNSPEGSKLSLLLVCAKCLDPLILNAALNAEEAQYRRVWALRCGHLIDEKCLNILGQPAEEKTIPDKKGKGKARSPAPQHTYGDAVPELQSLTSMVYEMETPDIRSRLRSRRSNGDPVMPGAYPGSSSAASPEAATTQQRPSPVKKRKVGTRKPKVEAEYEWVCPVASCKRLHLPAAAHVSLVGRCNVWVVLLGKIIDVRRNRDGLHGQELIL